MRPLLLLLAFTILCFSARAQKQEQYSRAKIYFDDAHTFTNLAAIGIATDHGEYKKNTFFISDLSAGELKQVKNAGFRTEILIDDVVKYYQRQNSTKKGQKKSTGVSCSTTTNAGVPKHFHLGTYAGGYLSYSEVMTAIDSMQVLYPGLISVKQPISTFLTWNGNPLYWVRISNNPAVDQPAKPQMLCTALHHAREPGSVATLLYYMWYLLENYSTDPHIKTIIDNTELYFVPCVNPDGYIYNCTYYPSGGGMLRKNQRDNLDGTYGVDLNRNYGKFWGYDNIGSSPATSSDTYRGPSGFSEPETQAIKWFTDNHHFKICLNYHTYHNDILYPWGYIPNLQTVDSQQFFSYGEYLTAENHYRYGTCNQVLNYISNGDSNDWMYGDTTVHKKIFAFTPEVGINASGFYPPTSQIIPDCQNNLAANIKAASLLLPFARINHTDIKIITRASGYLHYELQKLGFPDTGHFTASIIPLDPWLTAGTTPKVYIDPPSLQVITDSISYTLNPLTPNGQLVKYALKLNNGHYDIFDTVQFYYGKAYNIFAPSTNSTTDWINSGWAISANYYTPPTSLVSSYADGVNYSDGSYATISTLNTANLTSSMRAYLNFHAKWGIETDYDYLTVSASVAGSGIWQELCGKYTKDQPAYGMPMYDGQQPNWVQEEMDLNDFLGQKINLQFSLAADAAGNDKGFFLDDVAVTSIESEVFIIGVQNVQTSMSGINIYPNPANDLLNITVTGITTPLHAGLYDNLGRKLIGIVPDGSTSGIDVSHIPTGMYYLRTSDASLPVQKVLIQH